MNNIVEIPYKKSIFPAYYTHPDAEGKYPALILIHEVWGLNDHIKDVANRFMREGYAVLAPDLLSHTGITEKIDQNIMKEAMDPETRDEAQKKMRAAMAPISSPEFGQETVERLKECMRFLKHNAHTNSKIAVLGFCFGGTYAYALATQTQDLNAAIAFYGHAPEPVDKLAALVCPVLAFYGEQDSALMDNLPQVKEAMKAYGKQFEPITYPDTGHAFFNDTNPMRYNKKAAEDAWNKTLTFLKQNLE